MLSVVSNMCECSTDFVVSEQKENKSKFRCLPTLTKRDRKQRKRKLEGIN
jgi:hypothetical protein